MGFDIECIIDIHNYPGEYFCPVCRTLVYPNETLQAQCTHVFCKPCLSHVANNSRACPYDGYLVTEVDSKPLLQSDKAYAETIGKVKVRCLYHRSGCIWEGSLSDCTSHCSGCSFGNSRVICNRCGVQIVHRQVHDHAQSCPGVYQVQQAPDATHSVPGSNQNQATSQAGALTSQVQKPPGVPAPLLSGQDPNQKANANSQAPDAVPVAASTTEQWYQQYYQQYAGYDPYQQAYQQYYPYQQLGVQQYQQHPQQVFGQVPAYVQAAQQPAQPQSLLQHHAQPQSLPQHPTQPQSLPQHPNQPQALPQHPTQPQALPQHPAQPQAVPQLPTQPKPLPQHPTQPQALPQHPAQPQALPQHLAQPQAPPQHPAQPQAPLQPSAQHLAVQPQTKNQAQVHQRGASLIHSQVQPLAPPNQSQPPVNPPQLHSAVQPHGQIPSQSHQPPSAPQSQHHNPAQPQTVQPPPQHVQALYPQPRLALNHPQLSYHHLQAQMLTSQPQPPAQMQPQSRLRPSLPNQPVAVAAQPQLVQSSGHAVSGHQSYVQPQPPQQHPIPAHPAGGSFPSGQMQPQGLLQPPLIHPPSHVTVSSQQQGLFPPHGQVSSMPSAQQQHFHHQNPPLSYPSQQRPMIDSSQPSLQKYVQQPLSSVQSQLSQHNHLAPSPSLQSQLQSQGPPQAMQQNLNVYPQLQQNVPAIPGVQPQRPLNYVGRPLMPNQGAPVQPQPLAQSFSGYGAGAQAKPAQFGQYEHSTDQSYANKTHGQLQTVLEQQVLQSGMTSTSGVQLRQDENVSEKSVTFETGLPSQNATEMVANAPRVDSLEAKPVKSEVGMTFEQETNRESAEKSRKSVSLAWDAGSEVHGGKVGSDQPIGKLSFKEEHTGYSLENSSDLKLTDIAKFREITGDTRSEDVESNKSQTTIFIKPGDETLQSTIGSINQQKSSGPPLLQSVPPFGPKSHAQVPGHPIVPAMPQGSGLLPQPRVPFTSNEQFQQLPLPKQPHDAAYTGISVFSSAGSFGKGPVSFSASQGPPLTTLPTGLGDSQGGIMGRPSQNSDGDYSKLARVPFSHPSGIEPNALRLNEGHWFNRSSFDSQEERFKVFPREHLNPFTKDPSWPQDQGSRSLDMAPHGLNYDVGLTVDSANGGMVKRDMEHLTSRSPDKDYLGRKAHSLGDGSRFNMPVGPPGNPFPENRFLPLPGFPRRGDHDGPEGLRFGENRVPGLHGHVRRADWFGQDVPPSHFRRGENSPNRFGPFPGHARMGELSGPANPPHKFHYGEPFASDRPVHRPGETGFRSRFSLQGFPNDGPFAGDWGHFDNSRKRKYLSMGWCRICKVDCETVEGLDMHSQTREHQKMSMDMVMSIKQQNKKKAKTSSDRAGRELGGKKGNHGPEARGKKP